MMGRNQMRTPYIVITVITFTFKSLFHMIFSHLSLAFNVLMNIYLFHNVFASYVLGSHCKTFIRVTFVSQKG